MFSGVQTAELLDCALCSVQLVGSDYGNLWWCNLVASFMVCKVLLLS